MGIEPTYPAWKAGALPLSYTRVPDAGRSPHVIAGSRRSRRFRGPVLVFTGQGGIRTPVVRSTSDLQSDAIGRSATCPLPPLISSGFRFLTDFRMSPMELAVGVEPTTTGLQNRCSTVELR